MIVKKLWIVFLVCVSSVLAYAVQVSVELVPDAWTGHCNPVEIGGRKGWQSEPWKGLQSRYFFFDVKDPAFKNGKAPELKVTLKYFDTVSVPVTLQYDSTDSSIKHKDGDGAWKQGQTFRPSGTGGLKSYTWTVPDAMFANRCGNHDFRIAIGENTDFTIESVVVETVGSVAEQPVSAADDDGTATLCPRTWGTVANPVIIAGRSAWQSQQWKEETGGRYFYFDIQDSLLKNGNADHVTVTLTYLDQFNVPVFLQYDSSDTSVSSPQGDGVWRRAETFTTGDSGEWKTFTWALDDTLFKSRCSGHDFRIAVGANVDFVIAGCAVSGTPKQTFIMPDVLSSDMILQRDAPVPVWGQAEDGTVVTVSFNSFDLECTARDGRWRVIFPPMAASAQPLTMTISSDSGAPEIQYSNILIGDVWFASGQSNMEMQLGAAKGADEAIAASADPQLRLFKVDKELENTVPPLGTAWTVAGPSTVPSMSAVGYYFVREIRQTQDIPVGLLQCAYGGTVTETWCSPEVMSQGWPDWEAFETRSLQNPDWPRRNTSSALYGRMLKTVMPFAVKGFLWYQGEGNAARAEEQKKLFPAMVADWRKSWGSETLPFYIVQLARFDQATWHEFRCAQLDVWTNTPNTYMAVTIDLSKDWNHNNHPIHPTTKAPIGHRLALAARANVYGETDLVYSGPVIRSMDDKDGAAVLSFDHVGSGLVASDGQPLRGFYISADGETFVAADAQIEGDTVVVKSSNVWKPIAVRYGAEADMGGENLDVNLANQEMLPASPFTVFVNP